jgi:hypothetical protein
MKTACLSGCRNRTGAGAYCSLEDLSLNGRDSAVSRSAGNGGDVVAVAANGGNRLDESQFTALVSGVRKVYGWGGRRVLARAGQIDLK